MSSSITKADRTRFRNRIETGRFLADELERYAGRDDVIVLALPRGGVPVGDEVARALDAPLDVFVVRKLGVSALRPGANRRRGSGGFGGDVRRVSRGRRRDHVRRRIPGPCESGLERHHDLVHLGEAPLLLLGEDELPVGEHVELAVRALDDLGLMLRSRDYLGRETRGPAVVAPSDGAVVDLDAHGGKLPSASVLETQLDEKLAAIGRQPFRAMFQLRGRDCRWIERELER